MSSAPLVALLLLAAPADPLSAARSYAAKGQLKEAEAETRQYLVLHEDSGVAHFLLGYLLFREVKAKESLAEYTAGAKYQRPQADDLRVVGSDYVLLADYNDADKWFTTATQWQPENVLGWYYLGRTKYNENRFEEAIVAFERCLQVEPKHVKAQDNLGLSLQALGRYDQAQAAFLKAIEWQSNAPHKDPWPFIDLGSLYLEMNQPEKALDPLAQGIAIAPDTAKAYQQRGKAYLALQQLDKAQSDLEKAVQIAPASAPGHYVLGQLYQRQGKSEKAKEQFAQYARYNANHPSEIEAESPVQ